MNVQYLLGLITAHRENDDERFDQLVMQIVADYKRKGSVAAARDVEKTLSRALSGMAKQLRKLEDIPKIQFGELITPESQWDDLVLAPEAKAQIDRFLREVRMADKLSEFGLTPARRLLFTGPPGCGKTMCAEVLARELRYPLMYVQLSRLIGSHLGETGANLHTVFDYATRYPCVLFFDEVDALTTKRGTYDVKELGRVLTSFLQLLDRERTRGIIISATNRPQDIDRAFLRRFDVMVNFPLPTHEMITSYLRNRFTAALERSLVPEIPFTDDQTGAREEPRKITNKHTLTPEIPVGKFALMLYEAKFSLSRTKIVVDQAIRNMVLDDEAPKLTVANLTNSFQTQCGAMKTEQE